MINWLVGGLIAIAAILAIRYMVKQHKSGQCAGGCGGCQGCAHGIHMDSDKIMEEIRTEEGKI